jgi:hypothetical protein
VTSGYVENAHQKSHKSGKDGPRRTYAERFPEMSVRKVDAASVPYGSSVSKNGRTCWASYHGDHLIAVGTTADEARGKYIDWSLRQSAAQAEAKRKDDAAKAAVKPRKVWSF